MAQVALTRVSEALASFNYLSQDAHPIPVPTPDLAELLPANYRIPDILDHAEQVIGDVKNVARLSFTAQLQDYLYYALSRGYDFQLGVRANTELSPVLQALDDLNFISIFKIL